MTTVVLVQNKKSIQNESEDSVKKLQSFLLSALLLGLLSSSATPQNRLFTRTPDGLQEESKFAIIPFVFYNELLQFAAGAAVSTQGVLQDQLFGQLTAYRQQQWFLLRDFEIRGSQTSTQQQTVSIDQNLWWNVWQDRVLPESQLRFSPGNCRR